MEETGMKVFYIVFEDDEGNEDTALVKAPSEEIARRVMAPRTVLQVMEFEEDDFNSAAD